ncbi:3-hydroxyacyl-CoA dehydrogenase [Aerobium aerolatum]|uniref:L-gulonate 3-dehydrogenase n=1 Tax=Aquamicrobium aerolatum DSM 21857 TaxID=1121003 RepID=A0A1I3SJE0_9HYPH|nr:3-hydroxyacyl-CoA dehydrogenase [Aquamicrobium aerolatum]SFJ58550.1 3-hydroxyacyl-CoA dehydrogenase [Aquamicrobium aerolatum DSM 21857]
MSGHIAVIGAGLVGAGWAIVFARSGHEVRVFDASETIRERLPSHFRASLEAMATYDLITDVDMVLRRITVCCSVSDAVVGADYVQESVVERVDLKREVCAEIDCYLGPLSLVGSSTSGLPASSFTEGCANRERFVVAHPVNPPHLVPVVEIVPAPWTNDTTVQKTRDLMQSVGQAPVVVTREIPGFILNRLQGALLDEAWWLFDQGYATAEDIDKTVKYGLGLRWAFMGPFETIDLNAPTGIDDYARRLGPMYVELAEGRPPAGPWSDDAVRRATEERRAALPADQIDARRAWRDNRLMALVASQRKLVP